MPVKETAKKSKLHIDKFELSVILNQQRINIYRLSNSIK